jgi:Domain of unknown function (DUF4918)
MHLAAKILTFLEHLDLDIVLPKGVEVMNPFKSKATFELCTDFYNKYYSDDRPRHLIMGINPGRFGGGVTGIPFTDPVRLQNNCGIENAFQKKQELSSVFIYDMIEAFGGPRAFYNSFYISAVSPLGFVKNNKNLNYYDVPALEKSITGFVLECLHRQLGFGISRDTVFCLGEGKNFRYLSKINEKHRVFEKIVALPHPRFIMQYRLRKKEVYIEHYLCAFSVAASRP